MAKKYGGDLTNYGQTGSLYLKNLSAIYKAPKNQLELQENQIDLSNISYEELLNLVPKNWHDDESDYWEQTSEQHFYCKDGQTNAYVKRGTDQEIEEYFDREETTIYTWNIMTDDNHIDFRAGAKVRVKGIDWFVVKIIQQDSTSTFANKYYALDASPDNERLRFMGLKTLICIGGA